MTKPSRRSVLQAGAALAIPTGIVALLNGCNQTNNTPTQKEESANELESETQEPNPLVKGKPMKIEYLEIVTPEVDAMCLQYSKIYDVTFGEADPSLGGARTAKLDDGGLIGIRGPLRETETPVVRPYLLVDDIKAAVEAATEAGAEVAMAPMEIPGRGMFAIVIHGGIDCGFWQN